jgi:chromosome segregation ATPase
VNWQLTIKEILWRGYLPDDDPAVVGLDQRVEQAAAAYRQAREQREQVMKAITDTRRHVGACEQGIQEARRRIFLAQHHADLLARLESLREEDPHAHVDAMAPDFYVRQARWRAQVREVEAEIAEVLQAAGV